MPEVKKAKVEAAGADGGSGDDDVRASFRKLKKIQKELNDINYEARAKVYEVRQKCHKMEKDIYKRRSVITESIPEFWLTILRSHPTLADLISSFDEKILQYLVNLEVGYKEESHIFFITLKFSPNPYIENRTLVKEYSFDDNNKAQIHSSQIKWKRSAYFYGEEEKKGGKRAMSEESFLSWFLDSKQEIAAQIIDEVGITITEELWPDPLKYMTNEDEEPDLVDIKEDPDYEQDDDDDEDESDSEDGDDEADD